jgi:hypothetical protein
MASPRPEENNQAQRTSCPEWRSASVERKDLRLRFTTAVILNSQRSKNQTIIENLTFVRQTALRWRLAPRRRWHRRSEGTGNIDGSARVDLRSDGAVWSLDRDPATRSPDQKKKSRPSGPSAVSSVGGFGGATGWSPNQVSSQVNTILGIVPS